MHKWPAGRPVYNTILDTGLQTLWPQVVAVRVPRLEERQPYIDQENRESKTLTCAVDLPMSSQVDKA